MLTLPSECWSNYDNENKMWRYRPYNPSQSILPKKIIFTTQRFVFFFSSIFYTIIIILCHVFGGCAWLHKSPYNKGKNKAGSRVWAGVPVDMLPYRQTCNKLVVVRHPPYTSICLAWSGNRNRHHHHHHHQDQGVSCSRTPNIQVPPLPHNSSLVYKQTEAVIRMSVKLLSGWMLSMSED